MYGKPVVPHDFEVPLGLETERLRLRPLMTSDAVKDFDAVVTSAERLRTVFRPGGSWPDGLTLEQNLKELAWHEIEFQKRRSFAYPVVRLDESQVLGCLYIYPTAPLGDPLPCGGHDAEISMWVRASEAETGLDAHLYDSVRAWVAEAWPFANPAYPGREIAWDAWDALIAG